MNTNIERDFDFQAGLYFQDSFLLNYYTFTLFIEINTDSIHEQNIAMDRLKYFVYEVLESTIFLNEYDFATGKKYQDAGLKVCFTPDDPYDQVMCLMLLLKLNAICEGRLRVVEILLSSKVSDNIKFKENVINAEMHYPENGWWHEIAPNIYDTDYHDRENQKIVKLKSDEWKNIGLVWQEKKEKSTEIAFTTETKKP